MSKLRAITNPAVDRFNGYLEAASIALLKGQCDLTLEASFFEINDKSITNREVVFEVYGDGNEIEFERVRSLREMVDGINKVLTLPLKMWSLEHQGFPRLIEENLRSGFWRHLKRCFDYENAKIVELGPDVPWVNIGHGFTYVLYTADRTAVALLLGNSTD